MIRQKLPDRGREQIILKHLINFSKYKIVCLQSKLDKLIVQKS